MKIKIGLFYQYISSYKFKPAFRCKQIDNKNLKAVNLKPENSKTKKTKKTHLYWNSENKTRYTFVQ